MGEVSTFYANIGSGIRNPSNWIGTNLGAGGFTPHKNIQFHESNLVSGAIEILGLDSVSAAFNLSHLIFGSANSDTRYLVLANSDLAAINLVDRYTSYVASNHYDSAQFAVVSVASLPSSGLSFGSGKIVYFDYSLPSYLNITGLKKQLCYYVYVYAINGNGYAANMSSLAASINFTLHTSTLIAY
jgi:hypothetical protein